MAQFQRPSACPEVNELAYHFIKCTAKLQDGFQATRLLFFLYEWTTLNFLYHSDSYPLGSCHYLFDLETEQFICPDSSKLYNTVFVFQIKKT